MKEELERRRAQKEGKARSGTEVSSALEQDYRETLGSYVLAKYEQADRIKNRLEHIIDRQKARLQQRHSARQEVRLNRLRARLRTVREIREGTGRHGSRIEALAHRKMRVENPELAKDWDAAHL